MKTLLLFIVLVICCISLAYSQVAQFPQIYYSGQTGGSSLIRSNASLSASTLTTLTGGYHIGADAQTTSNESYGLATWARVCLPSTSSTNNTPNYGYMMYGSYYIRINEVNDYATVNTTSTPLGVRTCANCPSSYVTISGSNAYYGKNSILALTGNSSSNWYEIYLPTNCSQPTGWVNGQYLNINGNTQDYKIVGGSVTNSSSVFLWGSTITLGSIATTYSTEGFYQYKLTNGWSGAITCIDPNYNTSSPLSYSFSANNHNYTRDFVMSNTVTCTGVAISNQPQNQSATVGGTATFSVIASGTSPFTYQWKKNGTNISGATNSSYTTPTLTLSDNGNTYNCYITNCSGNNNITSNTATLTVSNSCTGVIVSTQPQNQSATVGGTATFSVITSGTSPFTYQWKKNGTNISGATNFSYTTPTLTLADNGNTYSCYITNCSGNNSITSNVATLTVSNSCTAVAISTQPQNQSATVGATATFSVIASGASPFTYQWKKNGNNISGATSSSYTTPTLTLSDNGNTYSCYITNCSGNYNITSNTVTLTVSSTTVTGSISATLGNGYFIQGISTVNNTFSTTPNPATNVNKVVFTAGSTTFTDNSSAGGWTATFDMGTLSPGTVVTAAYYNGSTLLGTSTSYSLSILAKPSWIDYADITNVSAASGNISMKVSYPFQNSSSYVPYSVKGFGGKDFSLVNNALAFDVVFNRTSRNSTISNPLLSLLLNTLEEATQAFDIDIPANLSTDLRLDNNFNLLATVSANLQTPHLSADYHGIPIALDPLGTIAVSVDAGISIYGELKARLVIGSSGGQWGFVDNGGDRTRLTARIEPSGYINGNVYVLYGAISAEATLDVVGRVGGGFEYVTVPSQQTFTLFGGDLEISGTAKAYVLWGLIPIKHFGPTTFYYDMFGDTSALRQVNNTFEQNFGASSVTYHLDGTHVLPDNNPQPCIATRGNNLFIAWVENDSTTGYLCFAKLDTSGNAFTHKTVITTNQNSIATPKIAAMEDGSALFSWSQNRYTESTLPNGISSFDALKAQDIWFGLYDATSNSVTKISIMQDDTTSFQSGRLEGEASTAFGNNEGLITWIVKEPVSPGSDVWFSYITKNGGNLNSSAPSKLFDLPGTNRNVNVVFTDSVSALAVWINDPDAIDSTLNSEVVFSKWNGTSWSTPLPMSSNNGNSVFSEVSMNHNSSYTVAAFTSTVIDANNKFSKRLEITTWNDVTKQWNASQGAVEIDSVNYVTKSTVAISENGLATVTYQVQNKYLDSTYIDPGELYLFTKDLNSSNPWTKVSGNEYLCDSSTYVWELASGFSSGNRFYTLTQEYNATGIVTNPNNGIIFGDPNLSLVLRGLQVTSNGTISDIAEPRGTVGIVNQSLNSFNLLQNYPNPFSKSTSIEFNVTKSSLVTLEVYNVSGIKVATLLNQKLSEGIYKTLFDAGNLESGVYFYKLTVNENSNSRKMILTR